ncbi:MAG TPA: response regulator [Candidatus Polarisedimenticolaceae bacterium]|nr:response regulator [Candidatus Polarisedimenticolaceae bacterium]
MGPLRILLVDDEKDIVEMLADVLSTHGFEVDGAYSAGEALDRIRETIYDAAILDFNLPDMDGVMLHRQIRQMDTELAGKSLFMSGLVQSDQNLGYYAAQSAGFLSKPFQVDQVLEALAGVLGRRFPQPPQDDAFGG